MAWNPEHKQLTREKILNSAAKLFTRCGFDNIGLNEIMADAGLTRGAFYGHFSSKTELYAESIEVAARQTSAGIEPQLKLGASLSELIEGYLSLNHRNGKVRNCPLAIMITDITQRDKQVRDSYTRVFKGFVNILHQQLDDTADNTKEQAIQTAVMMIGGVAIARAINDDDLAKELLQVCKNSALK
jgi:TetR/AcrR family transcriptional repressor of nem operon